MAELSIESIFSPDIIADPYPMYRQLREGSPILELADANMIILTRYEDVQAVLRDRTLGHADESMMTEEQIREIETNPAVRSLRQTMLLKNPPDHSRLRGLVVKAFDARRVEAMRTRIRALANELLDAFIDSGSGDLVRLFTHPLPVIVICDMLGVPAADRAEFIKGSQVNGRLIDPAPMSPEEMTEVNESTEESQAYFSSLCDLRRGEPRDDLITALVQSETEQGTLTKDELTSNISLLFAAGHETTVNLMGNALIALYRNRDQLDLLRGDLTQMPGAVEEFLRYDSSVQLSARDALQDTEMYGLKVPRGRSILTLLAAANRDPDAYSEPERLDITREKVKPLSFGGGIHLCLGAQLARIEADEALRVLFERLPKLELDDPHNPDWKDTITLRGVKSLPARW
ncbi:MAG: cytochrome P450 [Pseudomonadales bacterium]